MAFFIVTMSHPDGPEWGRHVLPHVHYLLGLIGQGKLKASGPLRGTSLRSGFLIFKADSRAEVEELVAGDPFAHEDLILTLTIEEWDPFFGTFSAESSKSLMPELAELAKPLGFE